MEHDTAAIIGWSTWGVGILAGWVTTAVFAYRDYVEHGELDGDNAVGVILSPVWPMLLAVAAVISPFWLASEGIRALGDRARRKRREARSAVSRTFLSPVEEAEEMAERLLERDRMKS